MHPKLAIADHTQKHHCPFLFPITKLYTVHSHHLTILADAFEYLLLVAKCESWSVKALIYLVLIAHVEDVLHYVGRFNLGSAVWVDTGWGGLDFSTGLAWDQAALSWICLLRGRSSNVLQGNVNLVCRASECCQLRSFTVLSGYCTACRRWFIYQYSFNDVRLKLIKVLRVMPLSCNAWLQMIDRVTKTRSLSSPLRVYFSTFEFWALCRISIIQDMVI